MFLFLFFNGYHCAPHLYTKYTLEYRFVELWVSNTARRHEQRTCVRKIQSGLLLNTPGSGIYVGDGDDGH